MTAIDKNIDKKTFAAKDVQVKNEAGVVVVQWADGHTSSIPVDRLRGWCPCAVCQGHEAGAVKHIPNTCKAIFDAELVGRYAIHFKFADGHDTGIFRWEHLRKLDPAEAERWGPPESSLRF
jgi:DUF971 family protein